MTDAAIRLSGIHKSFGSNHVLRGIDLTADNGEVVSIIGGSGSGKSTLLRCIPLLETPDSGKITVGGNTISLSNPGQRLNGHDRKAIHTMRTQLGFVFQNFNLWPHMTALQNVMELPLYVQRRPRGECREEAEALLERVGLTARRDAWPSQLSGGQQQRVAIARALAVKPRALLFDEPTSALDPELVGEVLSVIRGLAEEGRTMILVTHEMNFARHVSHRVIFVHQGKIDEQGSPEQVFENPLSDRCRKFVSHHLARV